MRYAAVATAVFLLLVGFVNENNLVRWARSAMELRQQRRQIEAYQKEIEAMDKKIMTLTNDRDSLEKYARETFLFARPGDDVYVIEE